MTATRSIVEIFGCTHADTSSTLPGSQSSLTGPRLWTSQVGGCRSPPGPTRCSLANSAGASRPKRCSATNWEQGNPHPAGGGPRCPIPLRPAAFRCSANGGGYDCSLAHSAEFYRPNPRLVETMNLRWTGRGADFVHSDKTLAVFDPSAHDTGRSALLAQEETLARFLDQTHSALVWAIIGEKQAIKPLNFRASQAGGFPATRRHLRVPTRTTSRRSHHAPRIAGSSSPTTKPPNQRLYANS